jgi:uncharacterized protein HemY
MDTDGFLDEIDRQWPQPGEPPSKQLVDLCLRAVREHPESSALWYDLGTIMQRCGDEYYYTRADYLRCYENAVKCDVGNWEAYQELAYVLDTYFDDYVAAERAFRAAIKVGAEAESYCGLARVLAQVGKTDDAINILSEGVCPFHSDSEVQKMRAEIVAGDWSMRPG